MSSNVDQPSPALSCGKGCEDVSAEWTGSWIWVPGEHSGENLYAFFRKTFSTTGGTLKLRVTGDSFYSLYLDGRWLARGPARSVLNSYSYDPMEIEVSGGMHCLGILGHHIGKINASIMTGRPGVLIDVILLNREGQKTLSSGPDWKCLNGAAWKRDLPDMMSHFGFWEDRDERVIPEGWNLPGFDDSEWPASEVVGQPLCKPWIRLFERDIPMPEIRLFHHAPALTTGSWQSGERNAFPSKGVAGRCRQVIRTDDTLPWCGTDNGMGSWLVVDFGRCLSGYVELDFSGCAPGQVMEISYDDLLTPEGFINPERSYAHLTDRFVLPGGACKLRTVHPRGFRYMMLDVANGGPFRLTGIYALDETYPFQLKSADFGDPWLNHAYEKSAETLRVCTTDAFTDCASRERVQWTQDLYLANRVAFYAFGDTAMMRRAIFQASENALPDGRINGFFPSERTNCAFASSSLLWLHQIVDYHELAHPTDTGLLIPAAGNLLRFLRTLLDDDGLIASWPAGQFWDWAPLEDVGCLLITNAVMIRALERLHQHSVFRDALPLESWPAPAELRVHARQRFWDPERSLFRNTTSDRPPIFSQQANAMAIWSGICPAEEVPALVQRITNPGSLGPVPVGERLLDPASPPSPEKIVPFGTLWFAHFFCEALFEAGMPDQAMEQLRFHWKPYDHLPNYPETRIQHGNTTLCHAWAAGPAYLLPRFLKPITSQR